MTLSRLETIANKLGVTLNDILNFNERIANFFDQCQNTNIATGENGTNQTNHHYDTQALQHQLEKAQLALKLCQTEREKAEVEARYWRDRYEGKGE